MTERERFLEQMGIDPTIMHMYDKDGVLRTDIQEDPEADMYHYGTPRHSGRYPWGSGENPYQRNESFLGKVDKLKKAKDSNGKRMFTEKQIAASMGMNTSQLRKKISLANAENRAYRSQEAKRLKAKGLSASAIGRRMGINESSVRLLLDEGVSERMSSVARNAALIKERIERDNYIDVGKGSEQYLGISSTSMANALHILEREGYTLHDIPMEQLGTGKTTTFKVIAKPGVEWKEVKQHLGDIKPIEDMISENGKDLKVIPREYVSVDPKRVQIRYAEEGGKDKDGLIELRRGVDDISLGNARYAQVRILVDKTHYLKGMAVYADDLPEGVDIRFNTSKHVGTPMINREDKDHSVLKPIKSADRENPFGANIKPDEKILRAKPSVWTDENGVEHRSALNIVSEEGTWSDWHRTLASQFLSKQPPQMAKQQLKLSYDIARAELEEIAGYTNPTVKASMLEDFAGRCETDAVHLAAAALPRQTTAVILPLDKIKDNEIYDPNHRDGEQVALVRYPHASITEIPILTVNNRNRQGRSVIGTDPMDAVGISAKAAARLSGADFDGDTVLVLPVDKVKIRNKEPFAGMKDFSPDDLYPKYPGMHIMTDHEKGLEMGKVTNLITDMTIQNAPAEDIELALRHSMVVIDAQKHELDFRRSERENHIPELKAKYQNGGGAQTLLSRSTAEEHIPERKLKAFGKMSPEEKQRYLNGEQIWENTEKMVRIKTNPPKKLMTTEEREMWDSGDENQRKQVRKQMLADGRYQIKMGERKVEERKGALYDPFTGPNALASGGSREATTPIERVYGDHMLAMKDLARQARKLAREQIDIPRTPEMARKYAKEVESLKAKLQIALRNAPLERQAQRIANAKMREIEWSNPEIKNDKEHYKREKSRQLDRARKLVGAKKLSIGGSDKNPLTDREWEAIQNGAVTKSMLRDILANADKGRIKELALPREKRGIPAAKVARAKAMRARGYTRADICDMLDISESTLNEIFNGK